MINHNFILSSVDGILRLPNFNFKMRNAGVFGASCHVDEFSISDIGSTVSISDSTLQSRLLSYSSRSNPL